MCVTNPKWVYILKNAVRQQQNTKVSQKMGKYKTTKY